MNKLSIFLFSLMIITTSFCIVETTNAERMIHSKYFSTEQMILSNGNIIEKSVINGPPKPPIGIIRTAVSLPESNMAASLNTILDVPAFTWSFGCSPTAASMIGGYYDRNGYSNIYTGPANGGVMPLNNDSYWTTWVDNSGDTRHRCPLSATQNGLDGRTESGHVDDYWIKYGNDEPDPFITNGWTEHTLGESFGDYMGSNQSSSPMNNIDGLTTFWNYKSGQKLTTEDLFASGPDYYHDSGLYGIKELYESRGYTVLEAYNQYIYPYESNTQGFTYEQYKAEIDAGRPVFIHLRGHSMVGVGYDDSSSNLIYIYDSWDHSTHTMTWGGSYEGMSHYTVSIIILGESDECEVSGDSDLDSVCDAVDNCPDTCNSDQLDADSDGIGDVCDSEPGCGGCGQPGCEWPCYPSDDYCRDYGPCTEGLGDCDGDSECASGLVCAQDVGANYGWPALADVCEQPEYPGDNYCAEYGPCTEGLGDCDGDSECASGLVCAQDVGANYGWPALADVCEN